jgi:hypothetical protein
MPSELTPAPVRPLDRHRTELKTDVIHVGDIIYCRSKRYRDSLGLPSEAGLVIEIKRANYKILYAPDKRAWIPREALVRGASADGAPFLQTLNFLLRRVDAHECEIISSDDKHQVAARIDSIDHTTVDELRAFLAEKFISLAVVPEGMAFMQLEINFRA